MRCEKAVDVPKCNKTCKTNKKKNPVQLAISDQIPVQIYKHHHLKWYFEYEIDQNDNILPDYNNKEW